MDRLTLVGNFPVFEELSNAFPEVINACWKPAYNSLILERNLFEEYPMELCMPIEQVLARTRNFL